MVDMCQHVRMNGLAGQHNPAAMHGGYATNQACATQLTYLPAYCILCCKIAVGVVKGCAPHNEARVSGPWLLQDMTDGHSAVQQAVCSPVWPDCFLTANIPNIEFEAIMYQ